MLARLYNALLSVALPQQCCVCADQVEDAADGCACRDCWDKTRIFTGREMLCEKCGAFFGDRAAPIPVFCHKCDEHFYEKAFAAGVYEKALAAAVIELKAKPVVSGRLKKTVVEALNRTAFDADVIIPVPLSRERLHERGFNQAELIAREISIVSGIAVDAFSLARTVHTPIHRVAMDDKARELSVKNTFEVVRPNLIKDKKVLLVDDVLTSGSTASYCAKALKKSGAACVNVFTLARAVMNWPAI